MLYYSLGRAVGCVKGFVTCFLEVHFALLGQHGSCNSAQLPVELSENTLQNLKAVRKFFRPQFALLPKYRKAVMVVAGTERPF